VNQTLLEIEKNIQSRKQTDRIMWFSWWAVLTVASFGIAWFPMVYYLIKRRNAHFSRQQKLEELILKKLKTGNQKKAEDDPTKQHAQASQRKPTVLTVLTVLIVPAFYVFYFLKNDLQKHEEHEHEFLSEVIKLTEDSKVKLNIQGFVTSPGFSMKKYVGLSVVTFGVAAAYWLYRIFNDYNSHFKMQWIIEDEMLRFLKESEKKTNE
jgi:hypothetical protein